MAPVLAINVGAAGPAISLTKSVDKATANQGDTIKYSLLLRNTGTVSFTNGTITDKLPSGVTFASAGTSSACALTAPGTVTCQVGALGLSGSAPYTISVTVATAQKSTQTNTATAKMTWSSGSVGANSNSVSTAVNQNAGAAAATAPPPSCPDPSGVNPNGIVCPAPANSAVSVPQAPFQIIAFPTRNFVSGSNTDNPPTKPFGGASVTVNVISPTGATVGGTQHLTPLQDPKSGAWFLDVNHPGGYCWSGQTPHMPAGSKVRYTIEPTTTPGPAYETVVMDVGTAFPGVANNGAATGANALGPTYTITVTGWAKDTGIVTGTPGAALPVAQVESRLVANKQAFDFNGRRTLRAGGAGKDGSLIINPDGTWTATYTGLDSHDVAMATDLTQTQARAIWLGRDPVALNELTIWEYNAAGGTTTTVNSVPNMEGPAAPCTTPLQTP
jgi:uncharacterized repeat protein (TIGR01451 family)